MVYIFTEQTYQDRGAYASYSADGQLYGNGHSRRGYEVVNIPVTACEAQHVS